MPTCRGWGLQQWGLSSWGGVGGYEILFKYFMPNNAQTNVPINTNIGITIIDECSGEIDLTNTIIRIKQNLGSYVTMYNNGFQAGYTGTVTAYSGSLGTGYVFDINLSADLETYTKYFVYAQSQTKELLSGSVEWSFTTAHSAEINRVIPINRYSVMVTFENYCRLQKPTSSDVLAKTNYIMTPIEGGAVHSNSNTVTIFGVYPEKAMYPTFLVLHTSYLYDGQVYTLSMENIETIYGQVFTSEGSKNYLHRRTMCDDLLDLVPENWLWNDFEEFVYWFLGSLGYNLDKMGGYQNDELIGLL